MKYFFSHVIFITLLGLIIVHVQSKENVNSKNIRDQKKPFRMAKINLIWEKALQVTV